jgi:hypothetical protein
VFRHRLDEDNQPVIERELEPAAVANAIEPHRTASEDVERSAPPAAVPGPPPGKDFEFTHVGPLGTARYRGVDECDAV